MLNWAAISAVIALVLGILGFTGVARGVAEILFWLFVIIAVAPFVLGFTDYKKVA